ncbi:TonB-dependent siderophore receptor [Undibacterium sp. CY18W]|uniref:TonB-dependent siderophore receptor n=1 Tax=Undibacterium hunanense TaxID=2762292 RepID=A0ABR6ZXG5_9BURK|nr:TonB-dependent receptor [Undibacterium hunanense]MBC3920546.1 TonB-dependent siderophore receptor [Undibacterium hunanense]
MAIPHSAQAQVASTILSSTQKYSIPAQTLGKTLNAIARQAGVAISVDSSLVSGKSADAIEGNMTLGQALEQALTGSGLMVVPGNNVITVQTKPAVSMQQILPEISVSAQLETISGRVNPDVAVGSKILVAQRQIAQSVSVVTQEQIQTQNMHRLEDAMRYVPGVTVRDGDSERMMFYARGFPVDAIQYDGVTINNGNSASSPALIMFDRVEVLRGPAGLLNGLGGSGGAVNMVRKRAPDALQFSADASAGSYNNYRGEVDIGTPLNESGSLRGRIAAAHQDRKFAQDNDYRKDDQVYATLEANLTSTTVLRMGLGYQDLTQRVPWNGFPGYSDYTFLDIPTARSMAQDWNRNNYKTTSEFLELEHKFNNQWLGKVSITALQHRNNLLTSSPISPADPVTGDYTAYPFRGIWDEDQNGMDAFLAGPFSLFGRKHQLTVGANLQYSRESQSTSPFQSVVTNIAGSNYAMPVFGSQQSPWITHGKQMGVYSNTRLSITDPLTLVIGARMSWWKNDVQYGAGSDVLRDSINAKITPNISLIYDINANHTVYASYSGIFTPQFTRDVNNHILKPVVGDQQELGIKGEYFDKTLNATLSLFRITEKNRAQTDPSDPSFTYYPQGKARSQGVETQISGELLPGLDMLAGYTLTTTRYLDASLNTNGDFETYTPKHIVKLWANYRLPDELSKWTAGGGVYISSKRYVIDRYAIPQQTMTTGGFATFDARIAYQAAKNIEVALSGTNLFNKHYYRNIGGATSGNFVGNPRELLLTLRYKM